jgi:hypothetical protein
MPAQPKSPASADGGVQLPPTSNTANPSVTDKMTRVANWRDNVPHFNDLYDASAAPTMTVDLYQDWLQWTKKNAIIWLRILDKHERVFRKAALNYHKIPYPLRHYVQVRRGRSINKLTIDRLAAILETNLPRSRQAFFVPWFEIKNAVADILNDFGYYQPLADDVDFLRSIDHKFEQALAKLPKSLRTLLGSLKWLKGAVEAVKQYADTDGGELLAQKYSREGSLFRRWMGTLPEMEEGVAGNRSRLADWYADRLLRRGVEPDEYWSKMPDLNGFGRNKNVLTTS